MTKSLTFAVALVLPLLFCRVTLTQPVKITENLRHEQVVIPLSTPDKARMAYIDSLLFVESGGAAGVLFFYDDPATKAEVDYIEFYDPEGHLLLVSWIDRLGICQAAMDRGLLDSTNPKVERTMVPVALGTGL
jgi:hypothetical protein